MKIFAIRDKKAGCYVPQLMLFENFVQAERQFDQIVNTSGNQVNRYPSDFCMVLLGEFDVESGLCSLKSIPDIMFEGDKMVAGKVETIVK